MAAIKKAVGGSMAEFRSCHFAVCFRTSLCLVGMEVAIIKVDFMIEFWINWYCSIGLTVGHSKFGINQH